MVGINFKAVGIGILIIGVFILVISGLVFFGGGEVKTLSLTGTSDNIIETPYTCNVPLDCETEIINDDAGDIEAINELKTYADIVCESNKCLVVLQ